MRSARREPCNAMSGRTRKKLGTIPVEPERISLELNQALELQPQPELHDPRCRRACNAPRVAGIDVVPRIQQVRVVEGVEHLPAELQLRPLRNTKLLEQCEVEIPVPRSNNNVPPCVSERTSHRVLECRGIEILLNQLALRAACIQERIAHQVRPLSPKAGKSDVPPRCSAEGPAALSREDTVGLPSAEDPFTNPAIGRRR